MAYSKQTLITDAMLELGLIDAQETPSAADQAVAKRVYDSWHAKELDRESGVYWPNTGDTTEEIPAEVYLGLVDVLAGLICPKFGKAEPVVSDSTDGQTMPISTRGRRELRRAMTRPRSGLPTRADYF
jgi:hypothetical protein